MQRHWLRRSLNNWKRIFQRSRSKRVDERYTSKMAKDAMLEMGLKKCKEGIKSLLMRSLQPYYCKNT
jgi:putative Holliday junction resolvase